MRSKKDQKGKHVGLKANVYYIIDVRLPIILTSLWFVSSISDQGFPKVFCCKRGTSFLFNVFLGSLCDLSHQLLRHGSVVRKDAETATICQCLHRHGASYSTEETTDGCEAQSAEGWGSRGAQCSLNPSRPKSYLHILWPHIYILIGVAIRGVGCVPRFCRYKIGFQVGLLPFECRNVLSNYKLTGH